MTRKEYQEECFRSFIQEEYTPAVWDNIEFVNSLRDAFNSGVDCADILPKPDVTKLSKIWHKSKEEPEKGEWILGEYQGGIYQTYLCGYVDCEWSSYVKVFSLIRWAYVNDLLPKGGEK